MTNHESVKLTFCKDARLRCRSAKSRTRGLFPFEPGSLLRVTDHTRSEFSLGPMGHPTAQISTLLALVLDSLLQTPLTNKRCCSILLSAPGGQSADPGTVGRRPCPARSPVLLRPQGSRSTRLATTHSPCGPGRVHTNANVYVGTVSSTLFPDRHAAAAGHTRAWGGGA